MSWTVPVEADFKDFFERDFNFAPDSDPNNLEFITNKDINRSFREAQLNFNQDLFGEDDQITIAFMYLTAFHLVRNLANSAQGLGSQSRFPISSNSVGGVSVSFQIPERYSSDAYLNSFTHNGYGMKYLELALPRLIANVQVAEGC